MTLVCVPIMVRDVESALGDARAAHEAGADLVEFRVDGCFAGDGREEEVRRIARLVRESPVPTIVTCRSRDEGGLYDGPLDAKVALYEHLGRAGAPVRYLDLEFAEYERSLNVRQKVHLAVDYPQRRGSPASLILSLHDTNGRPVDLVRRVARMAAEDAASVVKVAYRARSVRDCLELLDLCAGTGKPTIALGMGEFGVLSRVLGPKFGAFLTFATLSSEACTAPGQPTVRELLDMYRFRSIGAGTRVYGVIGWPVGHSMSPAVHNAGFGAIGYDAVYVPLPTAAGGDAEETYASFKATVLELMEHPRLGFAGASVTLPFKECLVRLAREQGWSMDEAAAGTGAGNTLVVERDSHGAVRGVRVMNTDVGAVIGALGGAGAELRGARVAILGAGGAARGAAWGLARAGARVDVYARDAKKALDVVRAAGGTEDSAKAWDALGDAEFDVCVNCTPVGMKGATRGCLLPAPALARLGSERIVMDMVYNPPETALLAEARRRGARVVNGAEVFLRQAGAQFEAWTGGDAPEAEFRVAFERAMKARPMKDGA